MLIELKEKSEPAIWVKHDIKTGARHKTLFLPSQPQWLGTATQSHTWAERVQTSLSATVAANRWCTLSSDWDTQTSTDLPEDLTHLTLPSADRKPGAIDTANCHTEITSGGSGKRTQSPSPSQESVQEARDLFCAFSKEKDACVCTCVCLWACSSAPLF